MGFVCLFVFVFFQVPDYWAIPLAKIHELIYDVHLAISPSKNVNTRCIG